MCVFGSVKQKEMAVAVVGFFLGGGANVWKTYWVAAVKKKKKSQTESAQDGLHTGAAQVHAGLPGGPRKIPPACSIVTSELRVIISQGSSRQQRQQPVAPFLQRAAAA